VDLKKGDVDYILRRCKSRKGCAPVLRKRGKEWFLDFAFEEKVKLSDSQIQNRVIVAVDLGLNNACTCSVMTAEGTILDRKFLSLPREQDSLNHAINRIKKAQQQGAKQTPRLWARAKGINDDIAVKTATFIVDTAILWSADVIVFEHLEIKGRIRGNQKQKLHMWKKDDIQNRSEHLAHRRGMRVSRICPWNTSSLAYDGSGKVKRDPENHSLCTFANGKRYNCDLSASYNIGARYFIREILKPLPATARSLLEAEVPAVKRRTSCVHADLVQLAKALGRIAA
jgi:IS605 OrfB family transposase